MWLIKKVPALLGRIGIPNVLVMYDYQETLEDLERLMQNHTDSMAEFRLVHTSFVRMGMADGWEPHNNPEYLNKDEGI